MAQKGVLTTADYLPMEEYDKLIDGLRQDELYIWELYCRISFYSSLRISDVLALRWKNVLYKDETIVTEKKTRKTRKINFNSLVQRNLAELYQLLGNPDINQYIICNPQTGLPYTRKHINENLKRFRVRYRLKIKSFSSHTFRKTFGRWFYESSERTDHSLTLLSQTFNHSGTNITRRYLGFTDEEIAGVFKGIDR